MRLPKTTVLSLILSGFAGAALGQQSVLLPPGDLAVFKAGDSSGIYPISKSKVQPCFVWVFDPAETNQAAPVVSVTLPTNGANAFWINAHAGSEGGGISLAANRQYLALQGYTGDILSPTASKPSSNPNVTRGLGTLDAFGNVVGIYSDLANWFGLPPGVTQNNPTGIATTDGVNFWGTGNVTGTSAEASGTLYYNNNVSPTPIEIQNEVQAAAEARIVNGVLYIVVPGVGVLNFVDPQNNNAVVPLPYDPSVPNPVQHVVNTNMFLNWGPTFANIANFDMNKAGTIAYGADQTYGIVKFVNTAGVWSQAPYYFSSTNIGTTTQAAANQGCFGICVDFSGTNPIIYATTMEFGNTGAGNPNMNRLIRVVDNGNPGTNLVAVTLSTAPSTNENFRGVQFTPDLRPLITSQPLPASTTNGGSATFTVAADSVYTLGYQWEQNGTNLIGATNSTLTLSSLTTALSGYTYECVVSNEYGMATSAPPALLTVSIFVEPPQITGGAADVTNYVGNTEAFAPISPSGTQPLAYQWYHGTTKLSDDGVKYSGSTTNSLSISNLVTGDSGNYYLVVTNTAGVASNLVDALTVIYQLPSITPDGQPQSVTTFAGLAVNLSVIAGGGTPPIAYQWYKGNSQLSDIGEFSGTTSNELTINPVGLGDSDSYYVVLSNGGGSYTSHVAQVTVVTAPPPSFVAYSNQVYVQDFDDLPDPGSNSVNSFNNPLNVGELDGVAYSLANPFDFTYPVITSGYVGGLGLTNMVGWYGAADTLYPGVNGITRFGAQDGDQSTGGVIDFGPNDNGGVNGTNRALGLLSTGTVGSTTFALKLINENSVAMNYVSLSFIGELWRNGTSSRTMSFGYALDNTASTFELTSESISNSTLVPDLNFSFPTVLSVVPVNGLDPAYQVDLSTNNMQLSSPWPAGGALWLIWSIEYYGAGSGNGYAIDNFHFRAGANPLVQAVGPLQIGTLAYSSGTGLSLSFTNVPGASFTVLSTTNLNAPIIWKPLGAPTEVPAGAYSTYQFTDPQTVGARWYIVTSP